MNALQVTGLTKQFGSRHAINGIDFSVAEGEIHGFLGPNGAGKTTTIRCIMDFIRPTSGTILVFGDDSRTEGIAARRHIGYAPADSQFYANWTSQEHFAFLESSKGTSPLAKKLAKKFSLDTTVQSRHLSTGNKQKLALVLAMMHKPRLLILDEPTRGLDPILQEHIYEILTDYAAAGGTVFISSHNLAEVERICKRVTIIRDGQIATSQSLQDLRGAAVHSVSVRFATSVKPNLLKAVEAEIISQKPHSWHCKIRGNPQPILQLLSKLPVADLEITRASLEDIFMQFYQPAESTTTQSETTDADRETDHV